MEKPDHISDAVWKKHLDWFSVTGETARRHLLERASQRDRANAAQPSPSGASQNTERPPEADRANRTPNREK